MGTKETSSMVSLVTSLTQSFKQVPPSAIPAMLDCILASTGLSPLSLFSPLIENFCNHTKDANKEDKQLDSDYCRYAVSLVQALCHLLKGAGDSHRAFGLFVRQCFIPLSKMMHAYDSQFLNKIIESFFEVVGETYAWDVLEASLVPFLLRSIGLSIGMLQNDDLDIINWGRSATNKPNNVQNDLNEAEDFVSFTSASFPLPLACHILTLMLEAAKMSIKATPTAGSTMVNGCYKADTFVANLMWDLCNMTERLLLQSSEHRSCTTSFLLPYIFQAFASQNSFNISVHGQICKLSRNLFFMKIWKCCKTLFSLRPVERRDAYCVLSLYFSFFSTKEGENADLVYGVEEFDIRSEREFWDEIKSGLVDDEGLVRKQSLQILKRIIGISDRSQCKADASEYDTTKRTSVINSMPKKELWAEKEAKSLGVGELCDSSEYGLNTQQQWAAFLLLYEMLEEFGTHLVEAAWSHQVTLLLQFSFSRDNTVNNPSRTETLNDSTKVFNWLSILWERGFGHENPIVRCMIMQSFLGIEWKYGGCAHAVPESFVFSSFMEGLNDPVHHKDFGIKGAYSSKTIEGAIRFVREYTSCLHERQRVSFLINLASTAKTHCFGRCGLMGLAECIASSANVFTTHNDIKEEGYLEEYMTGDILQNDMTQLLDALRFVITSSKQHFNPAYRLRVCHKVVEAADSVVCCSDVPLEIVLHFLSAIPREFTVYNGSFRVRIQEWLLRHNRYYRNSYSNNETYLFKSLYDFPKSFIGHGYYVETFDDEDLDAWESEARRWARILFLVVQEEQHLAPALMFIKDHGIDICKRSSHSDWVPVKYLILVLSVVLEIRKMQEGGAERTISSATVIYKKFANVFLSIMENLISFSQLSCSIFWTPIAADDAYLPSAVTGKLGGPSQRRLSTPVTTAVLQAIIALKSLASVSSWCLQFNNGDQQNSAVAFLLKFTCKTTSFPTFDSEVAAEVRIAAYEALAPVLKDLATSCSFQAMHLLVENERPLLLATEGKSSLDFFVSSFLHNINDLIASGVLARTRRAVLLNWKWRCLESLLSIMYDALHNGFLLKENSPFISEVSVRSIFNDLVESLENAGEDSVLHMLRSVRFTLELLASGRLVHESSSCNGVDTQMMWRLVNASWILHIGCKKRRIAPIAALLSSILHSSVFGDVEMHVTDNEPGPLKWFVEKVLEEGTKSPRTIRLAALHLTGLWLSYPKYIKYYIKELKLLTLYGSVQFDEDFEAELSDNCDARNEVSFLSKSSDPELTEVFINTELYARVSVAVLFNKLAAFANMPVSSNENQNCQAALESGKLFLLELLDTAVHDKDLSKELYKKYSAIHRRKVRVWQMVCVLSKFVGDDIVDQVTESLHISLNRNNLPAVRQYLETFGINIYLRFPLLVREQLVPILQDYDMRAQALSSYVFIAANVILHASEVVQHQHLNELLPPIIPLLTSHHHSLRAFTQLLVHQVLCKLFPLVNCRVYETMPLEKRCFEDLKSYLGKNSDCSRLRSSMEGFLDAYNPSTSVTPAGIFVNRVEENEFECVPTSLMDQVVSFLNDVRDDLRSSMAKDASTIKNESLKIGKDPKCMEILSSHDEEKFIQQPEDVALDFQKKIVLSKQEKLHIGSDSVYGTLLEMEKEDELLSHLLQSRSTAMDKLGASRQQFILVASFLDRIPNIAGLTRTCEIFRASGLAIADKNVMLDKQFQLISVTAEKWVPIIEVPVDSVKQFLEKKKRQGFSILGLEQTANSISLDKYTYPKNTVLVLGREKEGIPVDIIHMLDACIEIPQLGVVRSLNVHVSGAIALWEYTRQQLP